MTIEIQPTKTYGMQQKQFEEESQQQKMPTSRNKKNLKQPNFTLQGTRKRRTNEVQSQQAKENKDQSRNKQRLKRRRKKINETNSWFFEKVNKIDKS